MTAILGLNYLGGVLMMADTEESLGGDAKSDCDKLHRFIFNVGNPPIAGGTVLTGGSGDSHLIQHANRELWKFFNGGISHKADVLDALNGFARKFFKESMSGYQGFDLQAVPQLSMLIAVNIQAQTWLFHWQGNRVIPILGNGHASIGVGVAQTHPMLRDIEFHGTRETMLFLGIRIMFHAKRMVYGVGGKTEAIALESDGTTHQWGTDTTGKIEELVVNFDQFLTKVLYLDISNVAPNIRDLEKNVAKSLANLGQIMKLYRRAYKKILRPSTSQRLKGLR